MEKYRGPASWVKVATEYNPKVDTCTLEDYVIAAAVELIEDHPEWAQGEVVKVINDVYFALRAMEFRSLYDDALTFEGPTSGTESAISTEKDTR